jgi:hypothetical protein
LGVGLLFCFVQRSAVAGREVDMVALEERVGRLREGGRMGGVVWSVVGTAYGHLGACPVFSARRGTCLRFPAARRGVGCD